MRYLFLLLILSVSYFYVESQTISKVFLNSNDSTVNQYTVVLPSTGTKGVLILLPGFGENAERVLAQTALPVLAAKNGLLTIIPTLQDGVISFGVDSASQSCLSNIIKDVSARYNTEKNKLYIEGFLFAAGVL